VGRLERRADGYVFEYVAGALDARERGFLGFFEFPALAARYESESLFPLFRNRLMPTARPDYREYVSGLGLDPATADPMGVLARSGGTRATDRVELFAPPVYDAERRLWESFFLLRGVRHRPASAQARVLELRPQEPLLTRLDRDNPYNPRAVLLRTADGHDVGYLPDYMVDDIARLAALPRQLEVFVVRVNPPPVPVHHRVLGRLVAGWAPDFQPYSGTAYRSLVDDPRAQHLDNEARALISAAE
jgi:hypothetical protein